jgi:hypothetical protein
MYSVAGSSGAVASVLVSVGAGRAFRVACVFPADVLALALSSKVREKRPKSWVKSSAFRKQKASV